MKRIFVASLSAAAATLSILCGVALPLAVMAHTASTPSAVSAHYVPVLTA